MLKPGELIEHYRVVAEIGRGGQSIVYLVIDENLETQRALKELSYARDPDQRSRFHNEAKLAAKLDHPNIVTIHDHFVWSDVPYIVMQYHPLGSARPLVGTDLAVEQMIGLLTSMLEGLEAAEAAGIVHRDLKPDNLLRTKLGSVKIADFGIARDLLDPHLTPADRFLGNEYYVAPEVVLGRDASARSDLYSVGVIAYELFRGRPPFGRSVNVNEVLDRKKRENALPMRVVVPELPIGIARWVDRLLVREPLKRYPSASIARAELEAAADGALSSDWRQRSRLPRGDEPLPPAHALPQEIGSSFVGIARIKKIVSLPRHALSVALSPATLLVTGALSVAGIVRREGWMLVVAGLAFIVISALRFFDQQAAYDSRGLRFERIKEALRRRLGPAES